MDSCTLLGYRSLSARAEAEDDVNTFGNIWNLELSAREALTAEPLAAIFQLQIYSEYSTVRVEVAAPENVRIFTQLSLVFSSVSRLSADRYSAKRVHLHMLCSTY